MQKEFVLSICIICQIISQTVADDTPDSRTSEDNYALRWSKKKSKAKAENIEYEAEKKRGNMADLFGTNQHYSYPESYSDLGRRFVLQYPYKEVLDINDDQGAEVNFDNIAKAPPELVLAVAARAAFLESLNPRNRLEENLMKDKEILRSGNYWNGVWREDVDTNILRTQKEKVVLEPVKVRVMPESKIYKLVSELKKISPRLVYVINRK